MVMSLIKKAKDLGATAAEARQIAKELKNLNKKPTQDIFKKKFKQVLASRVDKDTGGSQKTADLVGTKGEKVTVAKDKNFLEMSKTMGSKERAKLVVGLELKETKGTITKQEKNLLDRLNAASKKVAEDAPIKAAITKKGQRTLPKGEYMHINTGVLIKDPKNAKDLPGGKKMYILDPTDNQKEKAAQNAEVRERLKKLKQSPERDAKQLVRNRMRIPIGSLANKRAKNLPKGDITKKMNKGGLKMPTADQVGLKKLPTSVRNKMGYLYGGGMMKKPRMSSMDYRKGGLLLIAIDMMKKKKKGKKE
jgi:hypothetical protein